jgi:hypothetical protein
MRALDISSFREPGLYLLFPDGVRIDLTRSEIESRTRAMLDDPGVIPPHVRAAADYQACDVCPERESAEICHAILTTLPFSEEIDRYMSYDNVVAVYHDETSDTVLVRETTMQEALKHITILSLMYYCEVGRKYYPYFDNVNPLMPTKHLANAVFVNMYVDCRGNMQRLEEILQAMREELLLTVKCQVKRLQLISSNDAFVNAFVSTHATTDLMLMQVRQLAAEFAAEPVSA